MDTLFEQVVTKPEIKPVPYASPVVLTLLPLAPATQPGDLLTRCAQEIGATCDAPGMWSLSDSVSSLRLSAEGSSVILRWWTTRGMDTVSVRNITEFRQAMFNRPLSDRSPAGSAQTEGTLITPFGLMTYQVKVQRKWAARPYEHDPRPFEGYRIQLDIERDLKWGAVAFEKLSLVDVLLCQGGYSYQGDISLWREINGRYLWDTPPEALGDILWTFRRRVSDHLLTPAMRGLASLEDARTVLEYARKHLYEQQHLLAQEREKLNALESA